MISLALPLALVGFVLDDDDDENGNDMPAADQEGTMGDDSMIGTDGDELLRGNGGDDILQGLDGNDTLFGNSGEDVLVGDSGEDMLCSGTGDDFVTGNFGEDTIEGQGGNDWVSGDYSNDLVYGNEGDDTVMGGRGQDVLGGGDGNDVLYGGILAGLPLSTDQLVDLSDGASLADVLAAEGQALNMRDDERQDEVYGGNGDDTLFLGGMDNGYGGFGADTFNIMADHAGPPMNVATIADFNAQQDSIGVVLNNGADAEITVADDGEDAVILADGLVIAVVTGGAGTVSADDIAIMNETSAANMLDPHAAVA
nr:hypothetical protein [Sulfitobacter aestuariivivens]